MLVSALLITVALIAIAGVGAVFTTFILIEIFEIDILRNGEIACIVTLTIIYVYVFYLLIGYLMRCPKCRRLFAMHEVGRRLVREYASTMDVRREVRNRKGEVIRTYTEAVPATRHVYECIDTCKYCGYQRKVRREDQSRD